jgi:hypothetical protein
MAVQKEFTTFLNMKAASVASFHGGSNEALATILNKIIRPVR